MTPCYSFIYLPTYSLQRGAAGGTAKSAAGVSFWDYFQTVVLLRPSRRALAKLTPANSFNVVGGLSKAEEELLLATPSEARAYVVLTWLHRAMGQRLQQGGLAIPTPLLSRTYQILSDAEAASQQAAGNSSSSSSSSGCGSGSSSSR